MLNKKDPLIDSVKRVMEQNAKERSAAHMVNEKFGITDRRALPHERQHEWDAAYKAVLTEGVEPKVKAPVKKDAKKTPSDYVPGTSYYGYAMLKAAQKKKMEEEALGEENDIDHPNKRKLDVAKPYGNLTSADFKKLRSMKEQTAPKTDPHAEGQASSISTVAPEEKSVTPADQSALTNKVKEIVKESVMRKLEERKVNPYAVGTAQAMEFTGDKPPLEKSTINKAHKIAKAIQKVNEGFNNRHSLSVTASAEKQTVAVQLNERSAALVLAKQKQEKAKQAARDAKTTGAIKAREPVEKSRVAPALDTTRNPELDKPGLEKAGVAQALKDPKAREVLSQTTKDAAQFAVPSALAGGPLGRTIGSGLRTAYNYYRNRNDQSGQSTASTARRPDNQQSVPQVQGQGGSSGRMSPAGPWGNIRNARPNDAARISAGRDPARSAATRDTFQGKLAQARQTAQQGRVGTNTAPAAARARVAQQTQQGRVGTNTSGATQAAARIANRPTTSNAAGANAARLARAQGNKSPIDTPKGEIGAPSSAAADTGPEKIKTSTQTTTTKQDYDKMSFSQAFKSARQQAGGASGKFTYKGKEYQTNIKGSGTAQKPQEKYQPSSKLKTVTPPSVTKTSTSVVGGQGIAAIPGGASGVKSASPTPSSPMASQGSSGSTQSKILPQRIQPTSAPAPVSQSMSANAAEGGLKPRSGQQGMNDTQRRDSNYNSGVRGK